MNEPLVANLYDLWEAGYSFIPRMAQKYESMYYELPGHYCDAAFSHPVRDEKSVAQDPWSDLRNLLKEKIFGESIVNLYDSGDALVKVVESYKNTDELSSGQLNELKEKIEDGKNDMKDGDIPGPPTNRKPPGEREPGTDVYDPYGEGTGSDSE